MDLTDLTVDYLRDNAYQVHFFGLGFIQAKLTEECRVHFYHPHLPPFVEEPHNHRYYFISKVLKGALKQTFWARGPEGQVFSIENESCTLESNQVIPPGWQQTLIRAGETITNAGSSYYMDPDTFHQVEPLFSQGPCVTFLTRGPKMKTFAQVARTVEDTPTCPFSKPLDEEDMWEIIADCLVEPL